MAPPDDSMILPTQSIAEGAWVVTVPLTGHSIGSVNCFVFSSPDGLLLVDPGWGTDAVQDQLTATLMTLPATDSTVVKVIASHVHGDHAGGLGYWHRRGADIAMGANEADQLPRRYLSDEFRQATARWSKQAGLPHPLATSAQHQVSGWQEQVSVAPISSPLADEEELPFGDFLFRVLETPGHTIGHICLLEQRNGLLLSGDTLFERITYGPTFRPIVFEDPLGAFRNSLSRLTGLADVVQHVHPGHLKAFTGLASRTQGVLAHHENRQAHVAEVVLTGPLTAFEIARLLPRTRPWEELRPAHMLSAVGDVLAHLVNLEKSGQIEMAETLSGEQVWTAQHR